MYWFCHLAVITELNGWDAFSPGHLDQHSGPSTRPASRRDAHARIGARNCSSASSSIQPTTNRAAEGGRDGGRERHVHGLRQHQPRGPPAGRPRRLERGHPFSSSTSSTRCTSCSPAATCRCRGKTPDARGEARAPRHPQRLRLPVALQRGRGGRGAAPPGQRPSRTRARAAARAASRWARSARKPTSSPATST